MVHPSRLHTISTIVWLNTEKKYNRIPSVTTQKE